MASAVPLCVGLTVVRSGLVMATRLLTASTNDIIRNGSTVTQLARDMTDQWDAKVRGSRERQL